MALLKGYLYVVADDKRQFTTIGMTRDVHSRFHQLKLASHLKLELVSYRPCTYAKFREARLLGLLKDLHLRNQWFDWDEQRIKAAIDEVLGIPDTDIRSILEELPTKRRNYPVKRDDTGEVFSSARQAAVTVLGEARLSFKIRRAIKIGAKCGPTTWSRA